MLTTPFGQIKIIADECEIPYEAVPYECPVKSVRLHLLTGSYRITVPTHDFRKIRCVLYWNCPPVKNTGSSGERYRDAEFINGSTILTIGVEDENPAFATERYPDGMEYILLKPVESVTFGIAWADDYTDGDVRTSQAADPTVPPSKNIQLTLSPAEAMVLADWLDKNSRRNECFEDIAEQYVMWNIECQLEKALDTDTYEDYQKKLLNAKETVRRNY